MDHRTTEFSAAPIGHQKSESAAPAHAPLPWRFVPWHVEEDMSAVRAPDGHLVCSTASDATAQIIVKAVNSHDALVKALNLALGYLFKFEPPDSRAVSDEFVAMAAVVVGDISPEVMRVIDAALLKAQGSAT